MSKISKIILIIILTIFVKLTVMAAVDSPRLNGEPFSSRTIILDLKAQTYTIEIGKSTYTEKIKIILDKNGKTYIPLEQAGEICNEAERICVINKEQNTAILYETYRMPPEKESNIIVDLINQVITKRDLAIPCSIMKENGTYYISLRSILEAFSVKDDKIEWNGRENKITIDRSFDFQTDIITIFQLIPEPYYYDVTTSVDINKIIEICSTNSFQTTEKRYRGICDYWVDFNNGTVIGVYSDEDYGNIENGAAGVGNSLLVPAGLSEFVNNFIKEHKI